MIQIKPRRTLGALNPLKGDFPYMESDRDYVLNNLDAAVELLDAAQQEQADSGRMTKQDIAEITRAMKRQRPTEYCHHGRGIPHSEACFRTCFSSWQHMLSEMSFAISQRVKGFDRKKWERTCE
jgi:hypothetical protein